MKTGDGVLVMHAPARSYSRFPAAIQGQRWHGCTDDFCGVAYGRDLDLTRGPHEGPLSVRRRVLFFWPPVRAKQPGVGVTRLVRALRSHQMATRREEVPESLSNRLTERVGSLCELF